MQNQHLARDQWKQECGTGQMQEAVSSTILLASASQPISRQGSAVLPIRRRDSQAEEALWENGRKSGPQVSAWPLISVGGGNHVCQDEDIQTKDPVSTRSSTRPAFSEVRALYDTYSLSSHHCSERGKIRGSVTILCCCRRAGATTGRNQ